MVMETRGPTRSVMQWHITCDGVRNIVQVQHCGGSSLECALCWSWLLPGQLAICTGEKQISVAI